MSALYNTMSTSYCNEYVYKNSILNKLILKHYRLHTTTLLNEFKIGKSIADLILINGEVKLFELKTELDTLLRLEAQLEDYRKVVEKVYIVVSYKHIDSIKNRYKDTSFGIIELTKELELGIHKEAETDKSGFDHTVLFKLLRKKEYESIIEEAFGTVPQVPNTGRFAACLELLKDIETTEFQRLVFKELKKRKVSEPDLLLSSNTPEELRFLCHSMDLKPSQYRVLFNLLSQTL